MRYTFTRQLEGKICDRIRELFSTTKYSGLGVGSFLPVDPIPEKYILVVADSASTTSIGEQDVYVRFRVLGKDFIEAEDIAFELRSFLDDLDEIFLEPITNIVTSQPILTQLIENLERDIYFFDATMHEVAKNTETD